MRTKEQYQIYGTVIKRFKKSKIIDQGFNGLWFVPNKKTKKNCPVSVNTLEEGQLWAKLFDRGASVRLITQFHNLIAASVESEKV